MNKELSDRVWKILPKEFKEEVKKLYTKFYNEKPHSDCSYGYLGLLIKLFGIHNLTSDAEGGEEELLCVSRKRVQELYKGNSDKIGKLCEVCNADEISKCDARCGILLGLFGSKCLPDKVSEVKRTLSENLSEQKPEEPKYKVGDKVMLNGHGGFEITAVYLDSYTQEYKYRLGGFKGHFCESDLEPYTEPEGDTSPNVSHSDIDIDELVVRGYLPDPAKQLDNILKGGFRDHNRLHIAAMAMQGILARIDDTPQLIADMAFRYADALIADAAKGGGKK